MILSSSNLPVFIYEDEAYSGVKKIADYVRRDMFLVFGMQPDKLDVPDDNFLYKILRHDKGVVVFGTLGKSPIIDKLIEDEIINVDSIKGKREVFSFTVIEYDEFSLHNYTSDASEQSGPMKIILIIGSDKRGTIYGLFHLSKLLGISPFVDWSDLKPMKRDEFELTSQVNHISKEPSVKYRGFFINDEWPAFGNFAMKRFGGVNAKLYEVIFTMLLRMNGNYLWPAMWASCFALDGPGLMSAELADELGVVMGLSHHEPCLRHGEEYSQVRGKDSIYGDAWNFKTNREGITRFWRDGLKRNGHLENVITIGMRGERDSMIMGKDATLADNIELLRDVISTQNQLIKEEVNDDLTKVPRMLALYKEVEPFFFGNENTEGLMGDECLEDVILLLCDDNHGYLRSRPSGEMRKNKNGYGLYYHFDYHGDPVSYEWVNSTYLPEVWEELVESYETGIRDLFIVNVGDVGFNEFALNYFLDFAYDYNKWGKKNPNSTYEYTKQWFEFSFPSLHNSDVEELTKIWTDACRINHRRRPEHMNENVYPAIDFTEALDILNKTGEIISRVDELENKCTGNKDAFIELISYQTKASMNLIRMWIYKGFNHFAAHRGLYITNFFADRLEETFTYDNQLTEWVHGINNGLYYGLALASHIGFRHWNDEECTYPSVERIHLFDKKCIIAGVEGDAAYTSGQDWSRKTLHINDKDKCAFYIALGGLQDTEYRIVCDDENISLSETEGILTQSDPFKIITISLHNSADAASSTDNTTPTNNNNPAESSIHILSDHTDIEIRLNISDDAKYVFDAADYKKKHEEDGDRIVTLENIGNTSNGIKLYGKDKDSQSYVSYDFNVNEDSIYRLTFKFLPCCPRNAAENIRFGYQINDSKPSYQNALKAGFKPGLSRDWAEGVIKHEREVTCLIEAKAGRNRLYYYPNQAENVLLNITVQKVMTV